MDPVEGPEQNLSKFDILKYLSESIAIRWAKFKKKRLSNIE